MRGCNIIITQTGGFWLLGGGKALDIEKVLYEYIEYLNEGNEPLCLNDMERRENE